MDLGPVELPVALTVGDPATGAEPVRLGTVHLALRPAVDGDDLGGALAGGTVALVVVDPDDLAHQLAALLDRHAAQLRTPVLDAEVVPDTGEVPAHAAA